MYDELVLLELKQFGGRPLTSVENDMQKDAADSADTIIGLYFKYNSIYYSFIFGRPDCLAPSF